MIPERWVYLLDLPGEGLEQNVKVAQDLAVLFDKEVANRLAGRINRVRAMLIQQDTDKPCGKEGLARAGTSKNP